MARLSRDFIYAHFGPQILRLLKNDVSGLDIFPRFVRDAVSKQDETAMDFIMSAFLAAVVGPAARQKEMYHLLPPEVAAFAGKDAAIFETVQDYAAQVGDPLVVEVRRQVLGIDLFARLPRDEALARVFVYPFTFLQDAGRFETIDNYTAQVIKPALDVSLAHAAVQATDPRVLHWICRQYLSHRHNGKPVLVEDLYKIGEDIAYLSELKESPVFKAAGQAGDLLRYKNLADLQDVLRPYQQRKAEKEIEARKRRMTAEERTRLKAETTIVYDGPEGKIVIPHTPFASQFWGNNTKWCISGKEADKTFSHYNALTPVIMLLPAPLPDKKVAIVERTIYDSSDETMDALSSLDQNLFDRAAAHYPSLKVFLPPGDLILSQDWLKKVPIKYQPFVKAVRYRKYNEVPAEYWADRDFVLYAVSDTCDALKHADIKFLKDAEIVLAGVQGNGNMLEYADDFLKKNPEIVLAAVKTWGHALQYAEDNLKKDPKIVLAAVQENGYALKSADISLLKNRDIVLAAVRKNGGALVHADASLQIDPEIAIAAIYQDAKVMNCLDLSLQADPAFVERCLAETDDVAFDIATTNETYKHVKLPDQQVIDHYKICALERIVARGDMNLFRERARFFSDIWGNADMLFTAEPAEVIKRIKAGQAARYPAVQKQTLKVPALA